MKAARLVIVFVFAWLLFPAVVHAEPNIPTTPTPPVTGAATNRLSEIELVAHEGGELTVAEIQGDYVYAGIGPSLSILDVSEPAKPVLVGKAMLPTFVSAIAVSGDRAYVATGWDRANKTTNALHVFDIQDPARPDELGQIPLGSYANALYLIGEFIYVPTFVGGLLAIDVSNPYRPDQIALVPFVDGLESITAYGNYLFLSEYFHNTLVVNVSNPRIPSVLANLSFEMLQQITVVGDFLYTLSCEQQIKIYDLKNPVSPIQVEEFYPGGCPLSMALEEDLLFVLTREKGLTVLDVSNPGAPGGLAVTNYHLGYGIHVDGDLALIYGNTGLSLVDVSNPQDPVYIGSYATVENPIDGPTPTATPTSTPDIVFPDIQTPNDVVYMDNHAIVLTYEGLYVFDTTNADTPVRLATYQSAYGFIDIQIAGQYAFVAKPGWNQFAIPGLETQPGGLYIFDIAALSNPVLIDWLNLPGSNHTVNLDDGLIIVNADFGGTYTLRFGSSLHGTLIDAIGEPLPGVEVSFGPFHNALTDAQGHFSVHSLAKGGYRLSLTNPNLLLVDPSRLSFAFSRPYSGSHNPWAFAPFSPLVNVPPTLDGLQWAVIPDRRSGEYAPGVDVSLVYTDARGQTSALSIPGTAITATLEVRFEPRIPSIGSGLMPTSNAFELALYGFHVGEVTIPTRIAIDYSDSDLRWIIDESRLNLYIYTDEGWQLPDSSCAPEAERFHDLDANRIEVTVCGSGLYSLMGPANQVFMPFLGDLP